MNNELLTLSRDVEASIIPAGSKVTLAKGVPAYITQSLGGSYTVVVNGNMFRIESEDADALGLEPEKTPADTASKATNKEELDQQILKQLQTVYDPEIPVNIVDLGLVYDLVIDELPDGGGKQVKMKMTLTAPGCGMGPAIAADAQNRILSLPGIDDASVEVVWDPPWHQSMISEEGKKTLGIA